MLIIGNKVLYNKSYSQSDENFDSMLREDSSFDLKWDGVKAKIPTEEKALIKDEFKSIGFKIPKDVYKFIINYGGLRPTVSYFDTNDYKENEVLSICNLVLTSPSNAFFEYRHLDGGALKKLGLFPVAHVKTYNDYGMLVTDENGKFNMYIPSLCDIEPVAQNLDEFISKLYVPAK